MNARLLGAALWLALALGVTVQRWQVSSEVPSLVASREHPQLAELSRRMASGPAARTLALVFAAPDPLGALSAARELAAEFAARGDVERVSLGPPESALAELEALYFPHRLAFADAQTRRLARASEDELRSAARTLRAALAGPESSWIAQHAARDPLLTFRAQLSRLEAAQRGALETRAGQWATAEGAAVLFVRTRASPFDATSQAPLLAALEEARVRLTARGVSTQLSALHRFAAEAQQTAQRDAQRISLLSLAAVAALFALLFRSLRTLAAAALQLALALSTASAVCLLAFGSLHPLTLAFGGALIGVCIDYPIHLAHHHALAGDPRGPLATLRSVAPALVVGALTSIAGFAGIAISDLPGLRELGVFGAVGLIAGLAALCVIAPIFPHALAPTPTQRRLAAWLARGYAGLCANRSACLALLAGICAAIALAAPRARFSDDVFALNLPPRPEWVAEEAGVQALLGAGERGRFVAVMAASDDEALERLEALAPRLGAAVAAGALAGFDSPHALLRSPRAQAASERALREPGFAARIERAFSAEGFAPGAFAAFAQELARPAPAPLRAAELAGSPLADALAALRVPLGRGVAWVVTLRGVSDPAAVEHAVTTVPGAEFVDQRRLASELYAGYRAQLAPLLGAGIALVALVLAARFRSLARAAAAGLPALLAVGSVLSVLALSGEPVTLLHGFGLLLVLCFAEDYGVFLVEARDAASLSASLTSILAASATTALSFGLLALSEFPALAALGFTAGVGSLAALVISPLSAAAFRTSRDASLLR